MNLASASLESIATDLIIIFVIRTRKPLFRSKPGALLLSIALLALVITAWLPLSPLASVLSLTLAHQAQAVALIGIVLAYMITAELLKPWFFRSMASK